jgi:hypothetical protein
LKEVFASIVAGKADPQWFTAEAQQMLFPDRIKEAQGFLGSMGAMKSFELMEDKTENQRRFRSYKVVLGETPLRCRFVLTEDGKIAGVGMRPE